MQVHGWLTINTVSRDHDQHTMNLVDNPLLCCLLSALSIAIKHCLLLRVLILIILCRLFSVGLWFNGRDKASPTN